MFNPFIQAETWLFDLHFFANSVSSKSESFTNSWPEISSYIFLLNSMHAPCANPNEGILDFLAYIVGNVVNTMKFSNGIKSFSEILFISI